MRVLVCPEAEYDAATDTCAAATWDVAPRLLPDLSVEQAFEVGGAIAGLWIVAYLLKKLVRTGERM